MKKVFILFSIIALVLILSGGIVDSLLALNNDINNHLWIGLVGRWQSSENASHEIEFSQDGTFSEYYYGVKRDFGEYQEYNNSIVLNYDIYSCERNTGNTCTVNMKLYFDFTTMRLTNNEDKKYFTKVGGK